MAASETAYMDMTGLAGILRQGCGIAIETRNPDACISRAAAYLMAYSSEAICLIGTPAELRIKAREQTPPDSWPLIDDALHLARRYAALARTTRMRLRIDHVTGDRCRKFHIDQLELRLLCTYAGPGVEWRIHGNNTIHRAPTGAAVMLRGAMRNHPSLIPVLHRSPPITHLASTLQRRLVLTIDTIGISRPQRLWTDRSSCHDNAGPLDVRD